MQKQKKARAIRCSIAFVLAVILILSSVAPLMAADLDTLKQEKEDLENQAASNQAETGEIVELSKLKVNAAEGATCEAPHLACQKVIDNL